MPSQIFSYAKYKLHYSLEFLFCYSLHNVKLVFAIICATLNSFEPSWDCLLILQIFWKDLLIKIHDSFQGPGAGAGARSRRAPEPCFPWSWSRSRSSKFSHAPGLLLFFNILFNIFFKLHKYLVL